MTVQVASLIEKTQELPAEQAAEVEDFVDFLHEHLQGRRLAWAAAKTSEPSFAKVWENADDAAYDEVGEAPPFRLITSGGGVREGINLDRSSALIVAEDEENFRRPPT